MFSSLSPDLSLYVLSYLGYQDALQLYSVSRATYQFCTDHEDALYHQLAVAHRFVKSGMTLEDGVALEISTGGYHVQGAQTWKDFCECR